MSACTFPDCNRKAHARELCGRHYLRWRRHGDPAVVLQVGPPSLRDLPCRIDGCPDRNYVRGCCKAHYHRLLKYGDPLAGGPRQPRGPVLDRLLARTDVGPDCWLWTGYCDRDGYGVIGTTDRRSDLVHRVAYLALIGPIPDGLELDHTCRVRNCVRPAHLEPVTHLVNVRRARAASEGK